LQRSLGLVTDSRATGISVTGYRGVEREIDPAAAAELFRTVSHLVAAIHPVLILPTVGEDDVVLAYVRSIVQQWQRHFGFFPRIEPLAPDEFARRLAEGDYDIAAVNLPVGSGESERLEFLYMSEYFFSREGVTDLVYNPFTGAIEFWGARL
jgi:hypothetical protein